MKIVHVTATPKGAPWMIALMREQKRLGHETAAIIPALDGDIAAELARIGIPCYAAPTRVLTARGTLGKARAVFTLAALLRRLRPDVVHSHILDAVVSARIASWIADVPQRFGGNVSPISLESDLLRPLELGTAFCDTATIASCRYTRDLYIRHGVPQEKVELIYYAVDQSGHDPAIADGLSVRRELGIPPGTPVVGKVAYFYQPSTAALFPHWDGRGLKGHDVLLRAVPRVLQCIPEAKFVLVGCGFEPRGVEFEHKMWALARSLGIEHAVLFPGERQDVPDVLAMFDVSVQCSLNDNLAGTVESLLMARPMVVSDIPGFADTVQHEKTGLVVPADNPEALAQAIVRLLRDGDLSRRLGEEGRRRMQERFTLARAVADVEELMARSDARAAQHYRLSRTLVRALAAPFHFLPIAAEVRRRRDPISFVGRIIRGLKRYAGWDGGQGSRAGLQEYDSAARKPRAVEELLDLVSNGPLVLALVGRDVKVRYKQSVFGIFWTMANPAAMLLVFTLAFSTIFTAHAPGYAFFVCPALLLWNFFAQTTTVVAREVAMGVDLWRRVRVPKSALVMATLVTGLLNLLLALGPLLIVLMFAGRPLGPALLTLPFTLALTSLFVLGVSLILGAIAVYFPDIADLYGVLLPALMFTAPIAYPATIVSTSLRPLLQLNPITQFVEAFRAPLYQNAAPAATAFAAMAAVAGATVVGGWYLFTRSTDDIPYRV